MVITGLSSKGSFTFDAITGRIIRHTLPDDFKIPYRVDIYEYFEYYGYDINSNTTVDIHDIGYWALNGKYVEPDFEWREEIKYNV